MTAENCRPIIDKLNKKSLTPAAHLPAHKLLEVLLLLAALILFFMTADHQPGKQDNHGNSHDDQRLRMGIIQSAEIAAIEQEAKKDDIQKCFHDLFYSNILKILANKASIKQFIFN